MSKYLLEKNVELKNKNFNDSYIDDILWVYSETEDEISNLILRYQKSKNNEFAVNDEELSLLSNELEYDYHILIKAVINYLISYSNKPEKSKLVDCCKTYIEDFFNNIDSIDGGLPAHNMSTIIKWTIKKYPRYKNEISNLLFEKIYNGRIDVPRNISLTNYLMCDQELVKIFDSSQYELIYDKFLVAKTDSVHIHFYLDIYKNYYDYILSNNKKIKNAFSKKYCDFVIENIDLIDNHTMQVLLQRIRDIMDDLKIYNDDQYLIIDHKLDVANKAALDSLQSHLISLPQEQVVKINDYIKKQEELFAKLSNVERLAKVLFDLHPIGIDDVRNNIESSKGTFSELVQEHILDSDGKVINYKELSESEAFSLKANQYISFNICTIFDLLINPFFNGFTVDDEVKDYIRDIMSKNKLVSADRIELMTDYFVLLLEQDFKNSVYNIVEELEESLRFYFKSNGMNIYKKNGRNDLIGLSSIFNDCSNNSFRDELLKVIDEDYYFTIKWFLVDNYGFGLRNKIAHRYKSKDLFRTTYSIYISLMILRLYWGFQNN